MQEHWAVAIEGLIRSSTRSKCAYWPNMRPTFMQEQMGANSVKSQSQREQIAA
jgi:hypothetical protein